MDNSATLSRRRFLQICLTGTGALAVGLSVPAGGQQAYAADANASSEQLNVWLSISPNNEITVTIPASEMGQGVYTCLAMLVAEELEVDWQWVNAKTAPADAIFNNRMLGMQATGASSSIRWAFEPLRLIGASARVMLTQAAASQWGVSMDDCSAKNGTVTHNSTGKQLRYGELVSAASLLSPPENVELKHSDQWRLLGQPTKRLDTPQKVNGSAVFGMDVSLPDMLVATVAACPTFGGTLESVDDTPALAVNGVVKVLSLDNAVVVVGTGYWPVRKALAALSPVWNGGDNAGRDTQTYRTELQNALQEAAPVAHSDGDALGILASAPSIIEATYEVPHLAHATMEPMNATAHVTDDGVSVWAPTQAPGVIRQAAAGILQIKPEQVTVHTTFLGGGFGRRFEVDFVVQAILASRMMGKPIKLIWSREEDTRHDFYRPASLSHFKATLDDQGYPLAWHNRMASPSILTRLFPSAVKEGIDAQSVEGASELPYRIPNQRIEYRLVDTGVPVGFWRSVGHSQNAFFIQSFLDELATSAMIDPLDYQLTLLGNRKRHQAVLSAAAAIAQWPTRSEQRPMGLAVHESFGSFCALVVQLAPDVNKQLKVQRISAAIDCGQALNPDTVVAQIESSIVYGLTAAFYGDIDIENGAVKQGNFNDYKMLKLSQMPLVNVEIVNSGEPVGGIGEPGLPPLAPALCNAIFYATGKRIRRLPLEKAGFDIA